MSKRFHAAVLLGSALTAALLTWPTVLHLDQALLGSAEADAPKHLWTLWWIRAELLEAGRFPFSTDYVNFPTGMDLYPIEPLNGLIVSLLGFVPLVAAANLVALLNLTLTGYFGALLGRVLSKNVWGGLAAGLLLESSAFTLFTVHVGVGELQHVWWLPLGFLTWLRFRRDPEPRRAVVLGLVLVGAVLSCFYHGFFLALGVALLALITIWAGRQTPRLILGYGIAALLALALVVPVSLSFATSYGTEPPPRLGLQTYVTQDGHGQPITDPPSARLDPWQLIVPSNERRQTASREDLAYGGGRYLGLPVLLILLAATYLKPRLAIPWLLVGGVGIVLAMGSYLVVDGETFTQAGARLRLPFFYLNRALGYAVEALNFPVRFLALTATAMAALAGVAAGRHWRGRPLAIPVFVLAALNALDVQAHQLIPRPLPSFDFERYEDLRLLRENPGPVVDLSIVARADNETRRESLAAQISHGQKVHSVPVERIEFFAREGFDFVRVLPLMAALKPAFANHSVQLDPEDWREDFALLYEAGYRYFLQVGVGQDRVVPAAVRTAMEGLTGPAFLEAQNFVVYRLPQVEATTQEMADWNVAQEARLLSLRGYTPGAPLR